MRHGTSRGLRLTEQYVVPAATALVLASVAFRAWMLFPSWFLLDDFHFLTTGAEDRPSLEFLFTPYNGNLMPGGRVIAWGVAHTGLVNWQAVATSSLLLHAASATAGVWMLITVFGRRPLVLVPLTVFLTSAMATPSLIWWSAALNGLPLQSAYFVAIGAWVNYLRSRRLRWLAICTLAIAVGLFFWVKAVLIVPVLGFLAIAYFTSGPVWRRPFTVMRRYPTALVAGLGLVAGYASIYLSRTPDQSNPFSPALALELVGTMVGRAFSSTVVGGPWVWNNFSPPTAYAGPPTAAVTAAWVVIVLVVIYLAARRIRTLRAWVLVASYVAADVVLLLSSRAPTFGAGIGMELRYIADSLVVVTLAVGLATLPIVGAVESSAERIEPILARPAPRWVSAALVVAIAIGGVASSFQYSQIWHHQNAGRDYMLRVKAQLDQRGPTDFVPQIAPEEVFSSLAAPANNTDRILPLLSHQAQFPDVSTSFVMIDRHGLFHRADIEDVIRSPKGPVTGCGWKVTEKTKTIPLSGRAFDFVWWVRVAYLGSSSSPVTITLGDTVVQTGTRSGLNDIYLRIEDTFDEITFSGLDEDTTLCIDEVQVGGTKLGDPL